MEDGTTDPLRRAEEVEADVAPRRHANEDGFEPGDGAAPDETSTND